MHAERGGRCVVRRPASWPQATVVVVVAAAAAAAATGSGGAVALEWETAGGQEWFAFETDAGATYALTGGAMRTRSQNATAGLRTVPA